MAFQLPETVKNKFLDDPTDDEKLLARAIVAGLAAWCAKKLVDRLFESMKNSDDELDDDEDPENDPNV